jgi:hypothetical protein
VPDLNEIINHRARANHRIRAGAAVDRRVGADLDIVADDDASELRQLDRDRRIGRKAEPGLTDANSGMDDDARAEFPRVAFGVGSRTISGRW